MSIHLVSHLLVLGFFGSKGIDKSLANAPKVFDANRGMSSPSSSGKTRQSGKGLGKGSPGCFRKPRVTKRQQRNRSKKEFTQRKRKTDPPTSFSQPPKKIAPKGAKETDDGEKSSTSESASESSTQGTGQKWSTPRTTSDEPPKKLESRKPLLLQSGRPANQKRVAMIQELCKVVKDSPPNGQELEMFWSTMDFWQTLDKRLVDAPALIWNDCVSIAENAAGRPFLEQLVNINSVI